MTSVITLDGVVERLYKYMPTYTIAGFFQCSGGKLEEAEDFMCFRRVLRVRIEIDQL